MQLEKDKKYLRTDFGGDLAWRCFGRNFGCLGGNYGLHFQVNIVKVINDKSKVMLGPVVLQHHMFPSYQSLMMRVMINAHEALMK
jgi:hypothetical protein